jgi:hypothetical protein
LLKEAHDWEVDIYWVRRALPWRGSLTLKNIYIYIIQKTLDLFMGLGYKNIIERNNCQSLDHSSSIYRKDCQIREKPYLIPAERTSKKDD